MRIYVASKYENVEEVREAYQMLRDAGHEITYDWTRDAQAALPAAAEADFAGVCNADALILIPKPVCKGAWVEMGIALAKGLQVIVVDGRYECIFENLSWVDHVETLEQAVGLLDA